MQAVIDKPALHLYLAQSVANPDFPSNAMERASSLTGHTSVLISKIRTRLPRTETGQNCG